MYWTKIPTDLITCRTPDIEILSIVKYQLLWAEHEQQPTDEIALRYLTPKQLSYAKKWLSSIESQVVSDIKSVESNRKHRRINYNKNKNLSENVSCTVNNTVSGTVSGSVDKVEEDKIRIDKKKEIYKESLNRYGEFKNVCLPEEYYTKLQGEHSQSEIDWAVEKLDSWLDNPKQKSKLNKNHRGYFKKDSWVWEGFSGGYTRQFEGWENF